LLLALACSPCLLCWVCWVAVTLTHPHDRFLRLLRGDQQISVTRVMNSSAITPPFVIEDAETLKYLSNAFRAAEPDGYVPTRRDGSDRTGPTLHVQVWTDRFGSYSTSFELPNDERVHGMTVFCELNDHYYFWVPLPQPVPAPLAKVFAAERDWERAKRSKQ